MDGLTISKAKDLLNTGKTASELNTRKIIPQVDKAEGPTFASTLKEEQARGSLGSFGIVFVEVG